jgi:hypothetical protein
LTGLEDHRFKTGESPGKTEAGWVERAVTAANKSESEWGKAHLVGNLLTLMMSLDCLYGPLVRRTALSDLAPSRRKLLAVEMIFRVPLETRCLAGTRLAKRKTMLSPMSQSFPQLYIFARIIGIFLYCTVLLRQLKRKNENPSFGVFIR